MITHAELVKMIMFADEMTGMERGLVDHLRDDLEIPKRFYETARHYLTMVVALQSCAGGGQWAQDAILTQFLFGPDKPTGKP